MLSSSLAASSCGTEGGGSMELVLLALRPDGGPGGMASREKLVRPCGVHTRTGGGGRRQVYCSRQGVGQYADQDRQSQISNIPTIARIELSFRLLNTGSSRQGSGLVPAEGVRREHNRNTHR